MTRVRNISANTYNIVVPSEMCFFFYYEFTHISNLDSLRLTILESDSGAKTERSRSFDEGLDNYREEGRGYVYSHNLKSNQYSDHKDEVNLLPLLHLALYDLCLYCVCTGGRLNTPMDSRALER